MKRVWLALAGIGVLVAVLMVAVFVFLSTFDPNDYRGVITGPVKQATGRDLAFASVGEIEMGIPFAITLDGAHFANASWGSRPEMATLERMEVEVAILPLILGEVRINRIVVSGVDLLLETDSKGRGNWVFEAAQEPEAPASDEAAPDGARTIPLVRELALHDVTVTYRDGRTGRSDRAEFASLDLSADSATSAIDLRLEGKVKEAPVRLQGTIGSLRELFRGSQPFPVALEAQGLGATLAAKGTIARPLAAKGLDLTVSLAGKGLAEEAARAGLALPELPAFSVSGRISDPEGGYLLDGLEAKLGKTSVTGKAKLALAGKRPRIEVALATQVLDLSELAPAPPNGEAGGTSGKADGGNGKADNGNGKADDGKRLIPDAALPLEALGALDAKLTLKADKLVMASDMTAHEVTVSADLERGRLSFQPNFGRLAQGRLGGRLQVDQTGAVTAHLEARGIALGELLTAFGVTEAVDDGPFDADLDVRGKGAGLRQLLAGLDGEVTVVIGEGRIQVRLLDLAGANLLSQVVGAVADPRAKERPTARLKCGVLRASVKSGEATFEQGIGIETEKVNILGAGTIDLKTEAVDLGIRSEARQGLGVSAAGIASKMVRVKGTLAEPKVGVDVLGAAETAARVGGAVMTGGLSLFGEAAFGALTSDEPPCKRALGKAAIGAKAGDAPEPKKKGGVEGAVEDVGKGLKSLFGD